MAFTKTTVVTPATSTTGTLKRTVSDWIRRLNPAAAPICAMVRSSDVSKKSGDPSYGKGLIDKESSDGMKFEWFTSTPPTMYYVATAAGTTCTVGQHTGTAIIASNANFVVRDIIVNLRTLEVGIVNALTSTTTLTVTAVGGGWSCAEGDTIAMACNAQEEGSSTYTSRTEEPTNNYNFCSIYRYAVEVADTAAGSPHYGEDLWQRYKKDRLFFAMRNMDNYLLLGQKAASETTTVSISSTDYSMYTTRGMLNYAAVSHDLTGTVDWYRLQTEVANIVPDTMHPDEEVVMLCGKKKYNWIQAQASKNFQWQDSGEKDIYGVRIKRFMMGAYNVKIVLHDLFNQGAMANRVLLFNTADFKLRFKKGVDLQIKENIQGNAAMSKADEIRGTIGLQCYSGGANVVTLENWVTE